MLSQVPQIWAAIEEEADNRDAAFLEASSEICGVTVLPFTLRRHLLLTNAGNAFVCGGTITPEAAAQFLWCVSSAYNPLVLGRDHFLKQLGERWDSADSYVEAVTGISAYLDFSFFDTPASSGQKSDVPSYYSFAAIFVDLFGREYGWSYREVMGAPLAMLFQLAKRIAQRSDPKAVLFNPLSDKAKAEYIRGLNTV